MSGRGVKIVLALGLAGALAAPAGCPRAPRAGGEDPKAAEQLRARRAAVYPEAAGPCLVLADFEDAGGTKGYDQLQRLAIEPAGNEGACRFVLNEARTGIAAAEVLLPAGGRLVLATPKGCDFAQYSLLSLSVFATAWRDDFRVAIVTPGGKWLSPRTLVNPGWNTVLFDIRGLRGQKAFDAAAVQCVQIFFEDAVGPVSFNLDDVMLLENTRNIAPAPAGMTLRRSGLEWALAAGGNTQFTLTRDSDGLWQLGPHQPLLQALTAGQGAESPRAELALMGARRIGRCELLECSPVRVRLGSTWYFPDRSGEWASLAQRSVAWEYTFYPDGRWVTAVEVNNAGGSNVSTLRFLLPAPGPEGGPPHRRFTVPNFGGAVGRWSFISTTVPQDQPLLEQMVAQPGTLKPLLADLTPAADGDRDKDGFDESQGCYFLRARAGQCRFVLIPPAGGVRSPAFRVMGPWKGSVAVTSEGLAVRPVGMLADGSAVFSLPGWVRKPTQIEVSGAGP